MFALRAALALSPESNAAEGASDPAIVFPEAHWREREPSALGLDGESSTSWPRSWEDAGVIKNGTVVKMWGLQSQRGNWASSSKPVLSTCSSSLLTRASSPESTPG